MPTQRIGYIVGTPEEGGEVTIEWSGTVCHTITEAKDYAEEGDVIYEVHQLL